MLNFWLSDTGSKQFIVSKHPDEDGELHRLPGTLLSQQGPWFPSSLHRGCIELDAQHLCAKYKKEPSTRHLAPLVIKSS